MSVSDIHPEDLLDKLRRGSISDAERAHLDAHLAECEVCGFELNVEQDLAEEWRALEAERSQPRVAAIPPVRRAPSRGRLRGAKFAAAVVVLASGAAAFVSSTPWRSEPQPRPTPPTSKPIGSTASGPRPSSGVASPKTRPTAREARPPAQPAPPAASHESPAQAPVTRAHETETARALFARANQERRSANPRGAIALYHRLQRSYPGSSEARLSMVTMGTLELNSGNPRAALLTFERYLQQGGPLQAEARYGRALALGRLGQSTREGVAWKELVRAHPQSRYAQLARERLRKLGVD